MLLQLLLLFIHLQDKLLKIISTLLKSNMSIVTLSQVVYTLVIADHGIHKFKAISCKHNQYQITSVSNVYCIREKRVKRNCGWSDQRMDEAHVGGRSQCYFHWEPSRTFPQFCILTGPKMRCRGFKQMCMKLLYIWHSQRFYSEQITLQDSL